MKCGNCDFTCPDTKEGLILWTTHLIQYDGHNEK